MQQHSNCVIFLVAFVAIGNVTGYYFSNGPPHRPSRELPINGSDGGGFHPEPKALIPGAKIPTISMKHSGAHEQKFEPNFSKPEPEPREMNMGIQLIPNRKESNRQARSCQGMKYSFANPGDSAIIQSPNHPDDYPNNVDSTVCFSSPAGTTMTVSCDEFNVEYERSCSYDYFGIGLGGDAASVQKYCGKGTVQSRPTTGNNLAVVFKSDYSNPGSNGREAYRFNCKVQVSGNSGGGGSTSTTTPPPDGGQNCNCGRRNHGRIVGGQEAKVNEFPWRCYLKTNRYSFFCGCSIISQNWILTAAHCTQAVMPLQRGDVLYAVIGDHDRSTSTETSSQQIEISNVYDHPEYDDETMDNDVSLLKLSRQIAYTNTISPVCLPFKYASDEFSGTTVTASGWGTTSQGGSVSNQLREVDLPVLTTQQCSRYYPGQLTDNMICTYNPGRDTCQGDSGGSIDLDRDGRYYAIGVVSWGIGCAQRDNPGVYAKTTKYLDWITSTTQGEEFCRA